MIEWYGVERRNEKIVSRNAAMAQLVERVLGKDEVTGSIPVSSSKKDRANRESVCPVFFGNNEV